MTPRFEVYPDASGQFRWRLRAGNGEIVASGEGHPRRRDAHRATETMRALLLGEAVADGLVASAGGVEVVDLDEDGKPWRPLRDSEKSTPEQARVTYWLRRSPPGGSILEGEDGQPVGWAAPTVDEAPRRTD